MSVPALKGSSEGDVATPVVKIVVAGPFGAGKTTFVAAAGSGSALGSESNVTDSTAALKEYTTVAMDHAIVDEAGGEYVVSLFGTPGQERFTFMWPILSEGMHAYVMLVDASRLQAMAQRKRVVQLFAGFAPEVPFLVLPNRWDRNELPPAALAEFIGVPEELIVECDPRDGAECRALLDVLVRRSGALEREAVE